LAGDGNYASLKATLLEKLPTLTPDKAFAFGMPGGKEVPEEQRRGIYQALNLTFKHADLPWRVTYSGTRKLFLCLPKEIVRKASLPGTIRGKYNKNVIKPPALPSNSMQKIIEAAETAFHADPGSIRNKTFLNFRPIRKAIQFVAVNHYKIHKDEVGKAFGLKRGAVQFNLKNGTPADQKIVNKIMKALGRE